MFGVKSKKAQVEQDSAGYMELAYARKDATCKIVKGQVSGELGCCNLFQPESKDTDEFRCGTCEYVRPK
jgi:hypothetical protein